MLAIEKPPAGLPEGNACILSVIGVFMSLPAFETIYEQAALRKGGHAALDELLSSPATPAELKRRRDDRYLAEMAACVFRSGFVWRIIEQKWPGFEAAFSGFDVRECAYLSDENMEALCHDVSIVRHARKIESVRRNAQFILSIREEHKSFGAFLADWPAEDFVGLWTFLKKRGDRLGGQTGRYFLRFMGWDSPILSRDVVAALVSAGVVDKEPTSQRDLLKLQQAVGQWREESGRSNTEISRILAMSVDA